MSDAADSEADARGDVTPRRVAASAYTNTSDSDPEAAPTASQAEAQFPYTSTQGLQPPAPVPPPTPTRQRRRPRWAQPRWAPLVRGGVAALFGLAIIVVSLVWGSTMNPLAPVPPASTAVRDYLDALARADAPAALDLASSPPAEQGFLTSRILAASPAPITGIVVNESGNEPPAQQVTASYRIGGRQVTATFMVTRDDTNWRLGSVAATVALPRFGDLPVLVNGQAANSPVVTLFPGLYRLGVDDPRYQLEDPEFAVEGPASVEPAAARLALSDLAVREVGEAARDHLRTCLAAVDFDPVDCGFRITHPPGTKLDESTVKWRVLSGADTLDRLTPTVERPGSAVASMNLVVRADVEGRDGSRWQATANVTRVYADLTGDQVRVQFG